MKEDFIHYLWKYQLLFPNLITTTGENLSVLKPGTYNTDSGPDFFNGRIRIGETTWAGNIEIHLKSSDWYSHRHENDPAYENIILHVVLHDDKPVPRKNGDLIQTLVLKDKFDPTIYSKYCAFLKSNKWIACENQIENVDYLKRMSWIDSLMVERLNQKAKLIEAELKKTNNDLQEVFYRKLARNFGFKTNSDAFELLATLLPIKVISKHKDDVTQIEALLFGTAGMLDSKFKDDYPCRLQKEYEFLSGKYSTKTIDKKLFKFMRMRPGNFATIRISQFAQLIHRSSALLSQILEIEKLSNATNLLEVTASDYWINHFRFDIKSESKIKTLGSSSINLIMINTIIPFLFVYGKLKHDEILQQKAISWLEKLKAENNSITRNFSRLGIKPSNAMHSQALIQLKNEYCTKKRCLECRIGHEILKPS